MDIQSVEHANIALVKKFINPSYQRTLEDELQDQGAGLLDFVIARQGDDIFGYGFINWSGPRDQRVRQILGQCPEIYRLEVFKEHQSRGIGSSIIKAFEARARTKQLSRLGLSVDHSNTRAFALYRRLGFTETSVRGFVDSYRYEDANGTVHTVSDHCRYLEKQV
jgi:ribosomal protein S18 acetylase RimI-like enzyme